MKLKQLIFTSSVFIRRCQSAEVLFVCFGTYVADGNLISYFNSEKGLWMMSVTFTRDISLQKIRYESQIAASRWPINITNSTDFKNFEEGR